MAVLFVGKERRKALGTVVVNDHDGRSSGPVAIVVCAFVGVVCSYNSSSSKIVAAK